MKRIALALALLTSGSLAWAQDGQPVGRNAPAGLFTTTGALKGNGSGTISQASCADLSNGACVVTSAIVNGTFDLTTATGAVQNLAFAFTPTACEGMGTVIGSTSPIYTTFHSFSDSTGTSTSINGVGSTMSVNTTTFFIASDATNASYQLASISYPTNTARLTWTKGGSPTGTFTYSVRCFR